MIFDDINQPAPPREDGSRRRHRHARHRHRNVGDVRRRRRSTFESASKLSEPVRGRGDHNTAAWLWMLGFLVIAAGAFALFLHHQKTGRTSLGSEAPSTQLLPFIDPVLAPLEIGLSGYDAASLAGVEAALQSARGTVNRDDQELFSVASTIASILLEASQDRTRHMQRLVDLGAPVIGLSSGGAPKNPTMTETERRHLELAVGVSWQRNSGTYRNRVEELWYRLLPLEEGRFSGGSASLGMVPIVPAASANE